MLNRELVDATALIEEHRAWKHDQRVGVFPRHRGECAIKLIGTLHRHELKLQSQGLGRGLGLLHHVSRRGLAVTAGMPEGGDPGHPGQCFLEERHTLRDELWAEEGQPRDVPTGPGETGHESVADRVAHHWHNDGDRGGHLLGRARRRRIRGDDEIELETNQFARQPRGPLDPPVCGSVLNGDVLALDIAFLA